MIQLKTMLNCIDNSGATIVECVANLGMKRHARIGDRIIIVVQKHRALLADAAGPGGGSGGGGGAGAMAAGGNKVRRGDLRHAVVVRAAKKRQRADGMTVGFDDNACVLITKAGEPLGTRVTGVVGAELRAKQWSKILSLAPAHV